MAECCHPGAQEPRQFRIHVPVGNNSFASRGLSTLSSKAPADVIIHNQDLHAHPFGNKSCEVHRAFANSICRKIDPNRITDKTNNQANEEHLQCTSPAHPVKLKRCCCRKRFQQPSFQEASAPRPRARCKCTARAFDDFDCKLEKQIQITH